MHISLNEGVVYVSASPVHYDLARLLSPGFVLSARPFTALTLWNSLAANINKHPRVPVLTGYGVVLASDWMTGSTGRTGSNSL
ncbi:hypothetical protein JOB18_035005 [Solea senegalensis]|uniref:Uncharacterized protein n=1 Tax=Solea senegalensis TaxID=28829 RepID=A0AAV6RDL0_SOLSE|nr:hypothetical protein JOB18_035005 [Solea senegalensis]